MLNHRVLQYGPMRVFLFLSIAVSGIAASAAMAQTAPPAAAQPAAAPTAGTPAVTAPAARPPAAAAPRVATPPTESAASMPLVQGGAPALPSVQPGLAERPPWRQLSGYAFPALADTVSSLQNMSYAMQLRDYCADGRIKDDFVRDRLARFSEITGREEDCTSLLRY